MPLLGSIIVGAHLLLAPLTLDQASASDQSGTAKSAFEGALAAYESGQFGQAAATLEALQKSFPASYDIHELLGMVYGAEALDEDSVDQLQRAADLKPLSLTANSNLAAAFIHAGQDAHAEVQARKALTIDSGDYRANRVLAQINLHRNNLEAALPFLESAQAARPGDATNGYDLALVLLTQKHYQESGRLVHRLQQQHDSGELHALLGRSDEQQGLFLDAASEFATASNMDPTEDNLFVWASELLLHRAYEAAITVFTSATERFPLSPRLWTGLGMAYYSRGEYPQAITALLKSADLKPDDPRCYIFLSKAYLSSPGQAEDVISRFHTYATMEPTNALAQYYYAESLWKGRRLETQGVDYSSVEALLRRSITLDPSIAETHLQLGILYNDEQHFAESLPEYQRAITLDPGMADAHFRLGRYYLHAGEKEKAEAEFKTFKTLQTQHQALVDQQRASVQQFVVDAPQVAPAQH